MRRHEGDGPGLSRKRDNFYYLPHHRGLQVDHLLATDYGRLNGVTVIDYKVRVFKTLLTLTVFTVTAPIFNRFSRLSPVKISTHRGDHYAGKIVSNG